LHAPIVETNSIGTKLVLIPPGEFEMGITQDEVTRALEEARGNAATQSEIGNIPTEAPAHHVRISKPFYMGMYDVTQEEYEKIIGINPSSFTENQIEWTSFQPPLSAQTLELRRKFRGLTIGVDTRRYPVETVSWDEALEFCEKLSALPAERAAKRVYRLPTEAEWEYACRAGTTTCRFSGDDLSSLEDYAWINDKTVRQTIHPVGQKKANPWGLYDMIGNVEMW
jgi:formylglycine-generating enzyme required for sulfatase activity